MKKIVGLSVLALILSSFSGCAHQERRLEDSLAKQEQVGQGHQDLKIFWSSPLFDDKIYFLGEGFNSNHKMYVLTGENPEEWTRVTLLLLGPNMAVAVFGDVKPLLRDGRLVGGYIAEKKRQ